MSTRGDWCASWVALKTGLPVAAIYRAHTDEMGCPGDFWMAGRFNHYTDSGLRKLAVGLDDAGHPGAAEIVRRMLEPARVDCFWWQRDLKEEAA